MSDNLYCHSCGKEWTEHDGTKTLCRKYSELVDLVIAAHIGEVMARARLKDFAEKEIEARQ